MPYICILVLGVMIGIVLAMVLRPDKNEKDCIRRRKRKRLEFAQIMTAISAIFSMAFVVFMNIANIVLIWNYRTPMTDEVLASINTYGGMTMSLSMGSYSGLTAVRSWSENKHVRGKGYKPKAGETEESEEDDNAG